MSNKYKLKVLVCAVERDKEVIIPVGNFILKGNDKIHVAAAHQDLLTFFQKSFKKMERNMVFLQKSKKLGTTRYGVVPN